jgi:hypothetical protein
MTTDVDDALATLLLDNVKEKDIDNNKEVTMVVVVIDKIDSIEPELIDPYLNGFLNFDSPSLSFSVLSDA